MMANALITRGTQQPPPSLSLAGEISLALSRVHEICGTARRTFALQIAAHAGAPVVWIAPAHGRDRLAIPALQHFINPGKILFVTPQRQMDILWSVEEVLKDGNVPIVVAELEQPPAMTPIRRLHLAAETGTRHGPHRPLGLLLIPGAGGAPGIETRWRCEPAHEPDHKRVQPRWHLHRLRARMLPPKRWLWDGTHTSPDIPPPQDMTATPAKASPHGMAASRQPTPPSS